MSNRAIIREVSTPDDDRKMLDATYAATANGSTIDQGAAFASIANPWVDLYISAIESDTGDESYTFALHQSDDNFAADDDTLGLLIIASAAPDDLDLIPNAAEGFGTRQITKRYIRVVITIAGTIAIGTTCKAYLGAM